MTAQNTGSPEERVKAKWKSALSREDWPGKFVIVTFGPFKRHIRGEGKTEAEAWADAASRLETK